MELTNQEQAEFWGNSDPGTKWLTYEDQLDQTFAPVLDLLFNRSALSSGMSVIDIGCGTGVSALTAAGHVGPDGHVLAADISQPFLARAQARATDKGLSNIQFQFADAQTFAFAEGQMDAAISRFGVMFFEDSVAAFSNIARALKPGGQMTFVAWGPLGDNPWFKVPHLAAVKRLGQPPRVDRYAPGPLAFHDLDYVTGMMEKAGLTDVTGEAVPMALPGFGGVEGSAALCTRVGPAARVIDHFGGDDEDVDAIQDSVIEEFRHFLTGTDLRIPAVINLFQARRPA